MNKDIITAIVAGVIGVVIAFFVTNIFIGEVEPYEFTGIVSTFDLTLEEPNPEVFNYRAINPTVEVFVNGDCEPGDEACLEAQYNNLNWNGDLEAEENPEEF